MRHSSSMKHPFSKTLLALLMALCGASPLLAAQAQTDELPPADQVRQHILAHPEVRAAAAALQADQADADRLKAGPHEFTVRLAGQQRHTSDTLSDGLIDRRRYTETQLTLERTLRTGNKARQDSIVGEAGVRLAQVRRADAIHEASRSLLRSWFDWLRERATVNLWQEQEKDQAELTRHAERRVKAGDAARTEWRLQEASAAQTHANLISAQAREAMAKAVLDTQYPGLSAAANIELVQPQQRDYPADTGPVVTQWLTERSHEWRMARLHAELIGARAERISQDRSADPTVGIYAASERGGAERVMGISLSLPLAGEARSAAERQALAQRTEAEQQAEAIHQKVLTEASTAWLTAQSALTAWQSQEQARQRHEQVFKTVVRAWELGEYSQSDVLLARRQFMETALAEINARAEARHAALRLKLDLHETWEFDDE
ncbi:MAG: TolC family protein [Aquabacterium sp.]|uniref:TolC family protein n=1 Tax=Aquabacterium sp. TaxID=1872578 RepID=UPI00120732C5|nr:TolC family protein [Aquabacterium sp.]TAK94610.1 MAG: TolC family protein [Aquabacterium sp.]